MSEKEREKESEPNSKCMDPCILCPPASEERRHVSAKRSNGDDSGVVIGCHICLAPCWCFGSASVGVKKVGGWGCVERIHQKGELIERVSEGVLTTYVRECIERVH